MSTNRQIRRDKCASSHRDTRWDRIRKRYTNGGSTTITTDTVRRFLNKDYIGKHNESLLNGEKDASKQLDPLLVMNLRHEMFQKNSKSLPIATVAIQNSVDSCIAHNMAVEEHYIENELNKFRQQLDKNHKRNKIKLRTKENSLHVDNEKIMESLEATSKHLVDFYTAPLEALEEVRELCGQPTRKEAGKEETKACYDSDEEFFENFAENLVFSDVDEEDENLPEIQDIRHTRRTPSPLMLTDEILRPMREAVEQQRLRKPIDVKQEVQKLSTDTLREEDYFTEIVKMQNGEAFDQSMREKLNFPEDTYDPDNKDVDEFDMNCTPSTLTLTEERIKQMEAAAEQHQLQQKRNAHVHFEDAVEVRKYERENSSCSNTSDGIDSVISDLAEEALMELQMEEEAKLAAALKSATELPEPSETTKADVMRIDGETVGQPLGESNELLIIRSLELPDFNKRSKTDEIVLTASDDDPDAEEETASNHEQNKIIEQLFKARAETNDTILRRYLLKWIHYTTIEKIERENFTGKTNRVTQINAFLDKIRKEKVRVSKCRRENNRGDGEDDAENGSRPKTQTGTVQIAKKYQKKIKVQQDLIDLQRVKLELQERLIMELKLNKLSDASKEARQEIKNELKAVIRHGDPKVKAKAKCLQLIGNLRDEEDDEFARLQGRALFVPKFLQKMQDRALVRSVRHEQARARRLQQEAEREALKMAAEEAKRQEDEDAKRMRIEMLKEKRRQEKMAKIIKERERQRAIENVRKAQEFCRRLLLRRVGMECFKRLLQRKRDNQRKCEILRRNIFKRTYFVAWRDFYMIQCERKYRKANDLYCKILKRSTMSTWQLYMRDERSKFNVASDWYDLKLGESIFQRWSGYTKRMKMIENTKMHQATSHHEWHLKWKVLDCWQRLPQLLQLEKETEERRQRWRMKIWELLPDYTPNRQQSCFH